MYIVRNELLVALMVTTSATIVGCSTPVETKTPPIVRVLPPETRTPILPYPTWTTAPRPTNMPITNLPTVRPEDVYTSTIPVSATSWPDDNNPWRFPKVMVTPTESVAVVPQIGDIITGMYPEKPKNFEGAFFLLRAGVGFIPMDQKTFEKTMPRASLQLQYHTIATRYWPLDDSVRREYDIDIGAQRTNILSADLTMKGSQAGPFGVSFHSDKFHQIDGFAINEDGRLGVVSAGRQLYLFEAYGNAHHQGPLTDKGTQDMLSNSAGIYWVGWGNGALICDGMVALLNRDQTVTIYRVTPLGHAYKEMFSIEDQKTMSGTTHDMNFRMMELNQKYQRQWIPYATLSKDQADLFFRNGNIYAVGK